MNETARRRNPIARILGLILAFQLALGALLFWGDLQNGFRLPQFAPNAPSLTQPIRPGDQTRRFRPDRAPPPGQPFPSTPLPDRLVISVLGGGTMLLLEGSIETGDSARMIKEIEARPRMPERILLNSPGGSVQDALELGRYLRAAGIETGLRDGDICYSACPYLLAAGVKRDIPEGGSVGVHQHYFGQNTLLPAFVAVEDIQRGQGEVMLYLDDMGINPMVMHHALLTPPDEIYVLLPQELRAYGFIPDNAE